MTEGHICKSCGWPVIYALCNDGMGRVPPYSENDWWAYCSNKTCEKHPGEPHNLGDVPSFIHVQVITFPDHRGQALGL